MTDKKIRFHAAHPAAFFLTADEPEALGIFLKKHGWIAENETVQRIEKPGEGNMNYVLRVHTDRQSLIVKQSRPWVERYPQLNAPIERIVVEAQFYEALSEVENLNSFIPRLQGFRKEDYFMVLEDLGEASDFTSIYKKTEQISAVELADLMQFISGLHQVKVEQIQESFPDNQALKTLNAEHILPTPTWKKTAWIWIRGSPV